MFTHVDTPAKPAASKTEGRTTEHHSSRPHLSPIVFGLIDARVSGIDFFDTAGGAELARVFRAGRAGRAAHRAAHRATTSSTGS